MNMILYIVAGFFIFANPAIASDKGEKIFKKKCLSCHTAEKGGKGNVGPNLFNIVARGIAKSDFKYSKDLIAIAKTNPKWTDELLDEYLTDPKKFLAKYNNKKRARSRMTFKLKKKIDRQEVIKYLKTIK